MLPFVRRSMLPVSRLWLLRAPSTRASKSRTTGPRMAASPCAMTSAEPSPETSGSDEIVACGESSIAMRLEFWATRDSSRRISALNCCNGAESSERQTLVLPGRFSRYAQRRMATSAAHYFTGQVLVTAPVLQDTVGSKNISNIILFDLNSLNDLEFISLWCREKYYFFIKRKSCHLGNMDL